jgi:hypothetical protein
MKKLTLFIVMLLFGMAVLGAQGINEYTYSTSTDGTLEDMTGSTALLTVGSYYDDTASAVTNIGFTFAYGTGGYTQFSANSNGQMQLGATVISGTAAAPALNTPRLAPISGDNAIRATGKLHYKVVGTSPNQKLVVEWLDLRIPYSSATETGTYCRVQAWLYETSNNIKFVYGTMYNMATSASTRGVYISTSNVAGTVGNWETITATPTWTITGTGVVTTSFALSSSMTNLNSAADGSRRVFSMNYPVYTSPPNAAVLVSPTVGGWAMIGSSLNWLSGGGGATSYDVYFGVSPALNFIGNQGSTSYSPTLVAGNTYTWRIDARNSFGATTGTVWSFMVPTATQVQESFENTTFPPAGWANPGTWSRSTSYYKHGVASAYKYGSASAQYVLSTPKVTITATSNIDLWTLVGTTTGTLQVVYSPDRTTWTQIGANITHAATYTWYNTNVNLSSLAGNNYYLGIRTGLQAVSFYVDMVIAPEITPEVPGAPVLSTPAPGATGVSNFPTFTWTAPTTGGVPTGYKIYCDGSTTPTTQIGTATGLTFTPTTPLSYITPYYWTVKAYNGAGDGTAPTATAFTTMTDPTIYTFPWVETFGTTLTFPLTNWNRLTGLYGTETPTTYAGGWIADDFGNVSTVPINNSARLNIWSTSTRYWTVTPPIAIPGTNYELKFDLALTTYSGTTSPTAGAQADDKFIVFISDSPMMTAPTILRQWNNTGSSYVYDTISNVGENHTISLAGITGTKYIGFYGESTVSGGDNNVYVDNVTVRQTPVSPVFTVTPPELTFDFGSCIINTTHTKQYTIANTGGGTITINSVIASGTYYSISIPPSDLSLTIGESTNFTVQYLPTAVGPSYPGSVTINYTGSTRPDYTITFSGSCYDPTINIPPAYQTNMETWPPTSWTVNTGTYSWTQYLDTLGNNWAKANFWSQTAGNTDIMVSPPMRPTVNAEVKFTWSHIYNATYPNDALYLQISSNGTVWTDLWSLANTAFDSADGATNTTPGTGVLQTVAIPVSYTNTTFFIRFYGLSGYGPDCYLDNVIVQAIPAGAPDHVTLNTPADGAVDQNPLTLPLHWTPSGTGSTALRYQIYVGANPMDPGTEYYGEYYYETTSTTFDLAAQPDIDLGYNTTWYWAVLPWNTDGTPDPNDPAWMIWSFTTYPSVTLPYSQNFDSVTYPALPPSWNKIVYSASAPTYVYVQTTTSTPQSAPNNVGFYNSSDIAPTLLLVSPHLGLDISNIKLSFYGRWSSYACNAIVGTMSDPTNAATFVQYSSIALTSTNAQYNVNFAAYSGTDRFIAIKMGPSTTYTYMYIDNVQMDQLLANDLAATGITGLGMGMAGTGITYNITVLNNGTAPQTVYNIHLKQQGGSRLATVSENFLLAPNASQTFPINWIPATPGIYNLVGEVDLSGDANAANNETTTIITTTVYPAGTFIPQIGDITSTTTVRYIPIDMFYKNSLNETIYLPHEMQCTSGTIQAIIFQNNFTQDLTKEIKIWMKNTTASDLSTAYLDFAGYQLVADVQVHFPLGVNAVVIPLDTPFEYSGGNLAVRTYRVWESVYWSSSNVFYYTADPVYPNRDRYYYIDGTGPIDPIALLTYSGDGGAAFTGTVTNDIPNTAFVISPATPITTLPAPVVTGTLGTTTGTLTWPAVPGAYAYRVYETTDPYNWPTTPIATVHVPTYTGTIVPFKFYRVTAITTYRSVDAGLVLNPAKVIGFDNSKVKAQPSIPNTEKK